MAEKKSDQELEVKFYLQGLEQVEARLISMGARLEQARVYERNLRFDTPSGELSQTARVLRLRQDTRARVTYKGPGQVQEGVRARLEIEFSVDDFEAARALFEGLGYQVRVMYEKYRATYSVEGVLVTLDEMPYGYFAEIEGPDGASIHSLAERLNLDWEARIFDSYMVLFDRLRGALGLTFRDLTFENFKGLPAPAAALQVRLADRSHFSS